MNNWLAIRISTAALAIAVFLSATLFAQGIPIINEFMADNGGALSLADGSTPDWIEIRNPDRTELDLAGWHLTDDDQDLNKWTFPAGATIAPGAYLLVYASGEDATGAGGEYHTNFKLGDQGEYLALVQPNGNVQQELAPAYPQQYADISYGLTPSQQSNGYFQTPTPGEANNDFVLGFVKDTTFSHKRGFYDEVFQLEVTTATPGATIRYTTDGSTPGLTSPQVAAPDPESPPVLSLSIDQTTIVRAYAEKPGFENTNIDTQTYLFLDGVIAAPKMSTAITGHAVWGPQMRDALLEIPSISLVTQEDVPTMPIMSPPEIGVSIEMIFPDGSNGFQLDAAIERFGGQFTLFPKNALRVSFKAAYGPKKLKFDLFSDTPYGGDTAVDEFDQILLRNGSHDSMFSYHYSHSRGTYIRNRYFFDRQIEAGHLSMRGKFVHVYLNGDYYGQFHLMERPNADFMATHLGGDEDDYDIMKGRSGIFVSQGNGDAWNYLNANLGDYDIVQDYMDLDSYIDYMLLNFYGGNEHDWYPQHNWVAGRKREPGGQFKFFMWDNDFLNRRGGNTSTGSTANTTDNGGPGNMLSALARHDDFKMRLADRTQKHFFNGGMLSKERVKADFTELAERISRTIIPESARWAAEAQAFDSRNGFYTPDSFQRYVDWIVDINAETRSDVVISQMRSAGLFPELSVPAFNQRGGEVPTGFGLVLSNDRGKIYYTTDGSDPRLPGGDINPDAIEFPGTIADFTGFSAGVDWKFYDDGDLGTAWRAIDFDDSSWDEGLAPLGFGNINGTTIATQARPSSTHLTFYCRRNFEISGLSAITSASLQVQSDGGAVVYINGIEAARDNMPDGPISFLTGSTGDGNEGDFDSLSFDHTLLVEGTNTIAVEVHNSSPGSGDMVIDLGFGGTRLNETTPIAINTTTTVRARNFDGGEWSPLNEATFLTGIPAASSNLVISEIHYNPSDAQGELAEYVELMNISDQIVDLSGVAFSAGIAFAFESSATIAPRQRAILVADPIAFEAAYGASATILGTYTSRLANGGERLTLNTADASSIQSVRYNDRSPWPSEADGTGYSLVLISPESAPDHELPQNWRASVDAGGNPGTSDAIPFAGNPDTDLLEYALGDSKAVRVNVVNGQPVFEVPRVLGADDATITVELSSDLSSWSAASAVLLDQSERSGNTSIMRWALATEADVRQYARVIVSISE
jgi:hypothetical protein